MQIYIGNLSPDVTEEALRAMFEKYGTVRRATIGLNKEGKSEGYGFVEMPVRSEARDAVEALRGEDMAGKPLRVKILKPGDEFHQHALNLHGSSAPGGKTLNQGVKPRTDVPYRGSGAVRRGGRRGG